MRKKDEIRKINSNLRQSMDKSEVINKSQIICNYIIQSSMYQNAKNILLYSSIKNEVDLTSLFLQSIKDCKTVYFPKTYKDEIRFFQVQDMCDLKEGMFHVLEPDESDYIFDSDLALLIAPGLAFSKDGHRIGFGKGYYDRFLSKHDLETIGVGYSFQMNEEFPVDANDIALQYLYSENGREL